MISHEEAVELFQSLNTIEQHEVVFFGRRLRAIVG